MNQTELKDLLLIKCKCIKQINWYRDNLSREGWGNVPLTGLTSPHICACPMTRHRLPTHITLNMFCARLFQMRCGWLFVLSILVTFVLPSLF